jgi:hypothetical protein
MKLAEKVLSVLISESDSEIKNLKKMIGNHKASADVMKAQMNNTKLSDEKRKEAKETYQYWLDKAKEKESKLKELMSKR